MSLEKMLLQPVTAHLRSQGATLDDRMTVGEALEQLRTQELAQAIIYFYAVDGEGRLTGVVPTRRLLGSALDAKVGEIMVREVAAVPDSATVGDAAELMRKYRFMAMPVVDDQQHLLGVVDLTVLGEDMAVDLHEIERDVFQLFGLRLDLAASLSPWLSFRGRFPWLLANICGGILCALVLSRHEPLLDAVLVLALFIPVVLTLSESVSIQSMTITLQSIHQAEPDFVMLRRAFLRELATSAMLGMGCGGLVGAIAYLWHGNAQVGLTLASALTLAMMTACAMGFFLPHIIHKLRGDPTIAAGPLVLVTTDIAALLFYLNIAGVYLSRAAE